MSLETFFLRLYYLTFWVSKLDSWKYITVKIYETPFAKIRNVNFHIEPFHLCNYHITFYLERCVRKSTIMTNLKEIFLITTVFRAILCLFCSLFKINKHYISISLLSRPLPIVWIIRECEFWISRKPVVWKHCKITHNHLLRMNNVTISPSHLRVKTKAPNRLTLPTRIPTIIMIPQPRIRVIPRSIFMLMRGLTTPLLTQNTVNWGVLETTIVLVFLVSLRFNCVWKLW